jgi:predicted nucleic acid-binding protein
VGPVTPVFDTNILIDYLNGFQEAARELARYPVAAISTVTWIEVMVGAEGEHEEKAIRSFLGQFQQVPVDQAVAEKALLLRRKHRIRLPDAIIWGTARSTGTLLITRNTNDFPEEEPDIRVPYRVQAA